MVPRPAPTSAASKPPHARTTSTSTLPFATASAALLAPPVSVPSNFHKSKQSLVGSSVPTIPRNLPSAHFLVPVLVDPTQRWPEKFLTTTARSILLNVPTAKLLVLISLLAPIARKDATNSTSKDPDSADSARPTSAWMASVVSVKSVHL